jgi:HK97 family phage major capsid protein
MAITSKELRNKAGKLQKEQQDILDAVVEKLSKEQEDKFDTLHDEQQALLRQADKIEKAEKMAIEEDSATDITTNLPGKKHEMSKEDEGEVENIAIKSYLLSGAVPRELQSFMKPAAKEKDDNDMIRDAAAKFGINMAAVQTTTTTGGGYTIPRGFQRELEKALLEYGGMWEAGRIVRTASGNTIDWPTTNDTANKAYLINQSTDAATSAAAVVFGTQPLEAYKYTSGLVQVPRELVEDSAFDILSEIRAMLVERIWRGTNEAFTSADGSSKPAGVIGSAGCPLGVSTAADGALAADDIVNLIHTVDPAYRKRPKAMLMFHDSVLKAIKKLSHSTSDARPLWLPSMRDGEPSTIYGVPYSVNQDFPTFVGAATSADDNKKIIAYGDFSKYIIRVVNDMRIVRLDERYAELDQVAFVVFFRVDGTLLNGGTNPIKHLRVTTT